MRSIYLYFIIGLGIASGGYYAGYSYCDYGWQKAKNSSLEAAMESLKRQTALLSKTQNDFAASKAARKTDYDKAKRRSLAAVPDCSLDANGMQDLVCAVRPSDCKR